MFVRNVAIKSIYVIHGNIFWYLVKGRAQARLALHKHKSSSVCIIVFLGIKLSNRGFIFSGRIIHGIRCNNVNPTSPFFYTTYPILFAKLLFIYFSLYFLFCQYWGWHKCIPYGDILVIISNICVGNIIIIINKQIIAELQISNCLCQC